jgi:hypothetical protein
MALKLGDLLLQEGVITQTELEEALKYQVIFGGKLGTNLIEMGTLEEEDITRALARKFGLPAVETDQIMRVRPEVVQLLPREIAERYRVIPLSLEGRRLTLAMADPTDLKGLDEIAFRTGFIIRPAVVAEVRMVFALEKYYGIERERRYIHAAKKIEVKKKRTPALEPKLAEEPANAPPPPPAAPESDWFGEIETTEPTPAEPEEPEELIELEEADIHEEAEETPAVETMGEEAAAERLVEALDRDDIFDVVLGTLAREFPRCAIFLVRGETALGWKCAVDRQESPGFDQLQIPMDEPSVLKTVAETKSYYLGPIPRAPFNSMMLQEMGGTLPDAALMVPLLMMGRVVGILYVDGKGINLGERLFDLQKLTSKAAMAFEILVLKNKILMM